MVRPAMRVAVEMTGPVHPGHKGPDTDLVPGVWGFPSAQGPWLALGPE